MNEPGKLLFHSFDQDNPLWTYECASDQVSYLHAYLCELGARSVVEEPHYFDRDYLAEHAAFYSISSKGYSNVCRRLHYFSEEVTRNTLRQAVSNGSRANKKLKESYLGFVVLRPIPAAPLGRTVLKWFQENNQALPRVTTPSREYVAHLAGIELKVTGLAWQQQDTAVAACATVGLWTMLHSSSFDDLHSIPTTVDITKSANNRATWGSPIFPSKGLTHFQLFDAISDQGLMPMIVEGDVDINGIPAGFERHRFVSNCASFIRSGYPVLLWVDIPGMPEAGSHIVVVGGIRSSSPGPTFTDPVGSDDIGMEHIYVHDDNIGPHARMKINEKNNWR